MYKSHLYREKAVTLRQLGRSYPEIQAEIPVVKSTLWMWLKDVELRDEAKRIIRKRRESNLEIGVQRCRASRIKRTQEIIDNAIQEVGEISLREQWLIGVALYWAEGCKEKEYKPGSGVRFSNSDPNMVLFFQKWLFNVCRIRPADLVYELAIHEEGKGRATELLHYWASILDCDWREVRVNYKRWINPNGTNRHKRGYNYRGMCRIVVRRSAALQRKITGWGLGIAMR